MKMEVAVISDDIFINFDYSEGKILDADILLSLPETIHIRMTRNGVKRDKWKEIRLPAS